MTTPPSSVGATAVTALENSDGVIISKNPLEVIGWDYSILKLKLTEDEYHKLALRTAQTLAALKHEDRTERKDISQHFNAAHMAIKDLEQFKEALNEFRQQRNVQKRADSEELQKIKGINQSLRAEVERLKKSSEFRGHGVEKLAQINTNLTNFVIERSVKIENQTIDGYASAVSLDRVKSLDFLSLRFSGSVKKPGRVRKNEIFYKKEEILQLAGGDLFNRSFPELDLYQRGNLINFIDRFVKPGYYIIIGRENLKVNKGRISRRVCEIAGCQIVGTLSAGGILKSEAKCDRNMFVSFTKISANINPYLIDNHFLIVDRKPRYIKRDDLLVKSQSVHIEHVQEKKTMSWEHSTTRVNSSTDLVILGLIIGINK